MTTWAKSELLDFFDDASPLTYEKLPFLPASLAAHVRFDEAGLLGHRQPKGAETDKPKPTATAPHSYSTDGSP
jgi:hypothetical protein